MRWRTQLEELLDALELLLGDNGGHGVFHSYRRRAILGGYAPDQSAGIGLVRE